MFDDTGGYLPMECCPFEDGRFHPLGIQPASYMWAPKLNDLNDSSNRCLVSDIIGFYKLQHGPLFLRKHPWRPIAVPNNNVLLVKKRKRADDW